MWLRLNLPVLPTAPFHRLPLTAHRASGISPGKIPCLLRLTPSRRRSTWPGLGLKQGQSCSADSRAGHVSSTRARGRKASSRQLTRTGRDSGAASAKAQRHPPRRTEPRLGSVAGQGLRGGGRCPPTRALAHKMAPSPRAAAVPAPSRRRGPPRLRLPAPRGGAEPAARQEMSSGD